MSDSEPPSPSSPSSQDSLGEQISRLSISRPSLTADSEEVKLFTILFNKSNTEEQNFYMKNFLDSGGTGLSSFKTRFVKINNNCLKTFLLNPAATTACASGGVLTHETKQSLFIAYRKFLDNFKFPLFSSTMSLPQLELLSMLIFSKREPEALSSCDFMVNSVDFYNTSNIEYERGTIKHDVDNVNELLDWLESIGIINKQTTMNLKLGKISKPANIPRDIEAQKAIKFNKTFFVFDFINPQGNKSIITMVLGETTGKVTDCKFIVYNITKTLEKTLEVEEYSWDVKIDDMTFHHGCTGGVGVSRGITGNADDPPGGGGAGKRRYSKSTNKTKRAKRARRTKRQNIKKNKSRRKYGKARNTKRKLRRFHH